MDLQGAELVCIFASPYTHPNDSIDMENREIYKAIKSIADELCSDGKTFLRADLAYELKKYGVAGDSSEVGSLVYDAYCFYGNDSNISIAFVTNNARTTIVADYKLNHCLEQGDMGDALAIAENELQATEHSLDKLQDMIALNLGAALAKGSSKAADWLTGTSGVKEVRGKASVMFDRYAKLVEAYRYAGDSVRANISDFTSLRSDIEATYREYALRLIDLYGDSIKMVSPELFDFNQVEFLDVDQMLRQIELEYSKIQDKCGVLIAEIADSFRTSLQGSMSAYRSAAGSSKTLGLAMAGLGMLDHYMAASEKANRLCGDLQQLQTSVKHDATRIKADMGRLTVIYKTLNDVVIPKSNVYLRFASQLMDSDFRSMTDALYGEASVRPLEEERRELLRQMRSAEMEMNDHLQNIDVYQSLVGELTTTLEAKRPSYQDAKRRKPSKPFFLLNWLTLGTARRNYYRNYSEWDAVCTPLIREFDNMQVDLKLDREELLSHQEAAKATKSEHARLAARLDAVSREIRSKIVCSDELKLKMLKHLRDVVAMLKLGREIAESRLDEKLLRRHYRLQGDCQVAGRRRAKLVGVYQSPGRPSACRPPHGRPFARRGGAGGWRQQQTVWANISARGSAADLYRRGAGHGGGKGRGGAAARRGLAGQRGATQVAATQRKNRGSSLRRAARPLQGNLQGLSGPDRRQERLPAPGLHSHQLGRQRAGAQTGDGDALRPQRIHAEHARLQ